MIKNYITTFLRLLIRQKGYSAINVFGLGLGIAAVLLLTLYIVDELSYDRFHKDADRIYRIGWYTKFSGTERLGCLIGPPTAMALSREVPQVQSVLRMAIWNSQPVQFGNAHFSEKQILLADSNFFAFFSFKLLSGNPKTALTGPNQIVLTESSAKKYFAYKGLGDTSPLGKILLVGSAKTALVVTGIAADPPSNSHFHFGIIASFDTDKFLSQGGHGWWGIDVYTYIKTYQSESISAVEKHFPYYYKNYLEPQGRKFGFGDTWEDAKSHGNEVAYFTQPLTNIHLDSHLNYEFEPNGNRSYLYLLGCIAVFILLLACINFMNLATARAANRAKEIGIRKTIGALRTRLVKQFMFESYLYTVLAIVLALGIVSLTLTPFNLLTGKELRIDSLFTWPLMSGIFLLAFLIGLFAGSYPAFYLSSFLPAQVLKGKINTGSKDAGVRNALVTFQFFISTSLIIATVVVYQQILFLKTQNPGFAKENILVLPNTLSLGTNCDIFKNELLHHAEIQSSSYSSDVPPGIDQISGMKQRGYENYHWVYAYGADYDHLNALGYQLKEGRYFSRDFPSDSSAAVINEAAANAFGIADLTKNHYVGFLGEMKVIGVIRDFNFESLKNKIGPLVICLGGQSKMIIRFTPGELSEKVGLVKEIWKKYSSAPFEYTFLDENLATMYQTEERLGKISILFTVLAIVIACLGLLGLVTYMAGQRIKEIGIRKVMGASVSQIVVLLSKDFARLVLVAFIIALPSTWYGIDQWLQGFAYRINFSVGIAFTAGMVVLLIAMITVSYQSIRAAMGNPVDSLRNE